MNFQYVESEEEVLRVSKVRSAYIKTYMPKIAEWASLNSDSSIIDVPCGTGDMSKALFENNFAKYIYLIDINSNMTDAAMLKLKSVSKSIVGDASDIEHLIDLKVDAVICLNGFHNYIDRKEDFISGCKKVLRSQGRLIFDVSTLGLNHHSYDYVKTQDNIIRELVKKRGQDTNLPVWANQDIIEAYKQMLIDSGFNIIALHQFDSMKTINIYNDETAKIPGRLRSRLPGLNDKERISIFLEASKQAQALTNISDLLHTRVFYVAEKK